MRPVGLVVKAVLNNSLVLLGGPEQFSGVIGVEEWYMRDSIDRKDGRGGRGIYCVVDVIIVGHDGFVDLVGVLVVKWEVKNLHAGVLDEVLVRQ